jgi:hypothetical protein
MTRFSFSNSPARGLQAAPQCPARPASSTLLQVMDKGSDQQIATEPLRRAGAMQLTLGHPQFGCRPIEQFGNFAVNPSGTRIAQSVAPIADATRNERRLATVLASRSVLSWRRHALVGSAML